MAPRWAKLERNLPHGGLNPGRWYPVESSDGKTGMVTVKCDELDETFEIHESYVTISNDAPTRVEIYLASALQPKKIREPVPAMKYKAVCPKGHDLGEVAPSSQSMLCPACGTTYATRYD